MKKPTVLLVPGAWHYPEAFTPLTIRLQQMGYETQIVSLPSVRSQSPPFTDHTPDTEAVRAALTSLINSGNDIVLFSHSYGSVPACDALQGLPKSRDDKSSGGILHVVHCNAFVLHEGQSLVEAVGEAGDQPQWFSISEDGMTATVNPGSAHEIFYSDIDLETAKEQEAKLGQHSAQTFLSKQKYGTSWKDFPTTYISSSEDNCVKPKTQQMIIEKCPDMKIVRFEGSHSPFLSQVDKVADVIREAVGDGA